MTRSERLVALRREGEALLRAIDRAERVFARVHRLVRWCPPLAVVAIEVHARVGNRLLREQAALANQITSLEVARIVGARLN